ncbi:restriction endonuclease subunit S [Actinomadura sp. 7K507]|uniref:restriction endonuclease subunit S n=1 Tax=Actinomadura sp. 7K507 TaxID=2530365 RepID=UPI001054114D|nr:restriction endonuclease subunit S [Actinomadura sp. 7K507]TDC97834.1 restriction endonuclease subunit S [Actinomadura sp. 7K507]
MTEGLIGPIPDAWETAPLGDVCQIQAGLSKRAGRESPGGVPLVMIANIANGRITAHGLARIDLPGGARKDRYSLRSGDVVFARTGDLGRCALTTVENTGWLVGGGCLRLRPEPQVMARYLVHYLEHSEVREWLRRASTGSVIPNLSVRTLAEMPVAVPPLDEQRAMTDILGLLDEKIAVHEEIIRSTVELRDSVSRLLFSGSRPPFSTVRS